MNYNGREKDQFIKQRQVTKINISKFDIEQFVFCDCWVKTHFLWHQSIKDFLGEKLDFFWQNLEMRILIKMLRCIRPSQMKLLCIKLKIIFFLHLPIIFNV